jgi:hypothetical protein
MNQSFLEALATYSIQRYETAISEICFVFPSRRAGLFFRKHLTELHPDPMWSPKILTIDEFIGEFNKQVIADPITLLFKLYDVTRELNGNTISFDEFMPWGEMLLADFDDLDKYLVDARQLFANLKDLKEIDNDYSFLSEEQLTAIRSFWSSFNHERLSEHQKGFLKNWEQLLPIYERFKMVLREQKIVYPGMAIRNLVSSIKNNETLPIPFRHIVIAGFFVLTPSEQVLFKYIKDQKKGIFFWDYSNWLIDDYKKSAPSLPFKEPGFFLQENRKDFPEPDDWQCPTNQHHPEITITGVASAAEQFREVSAYLEDISCSKNSNQKPSQPSSLNSAVILTDESLLIPVLNAIPPDFDKINVTLGYPLKNTPIYSLVESVINLQKSAKTTREGKTWFYFRDVLPLLQHQYISTIEPETSNAIRKEMLAKNTIFIESGRIQQGSYFSFLFQKINDSQLIPDYIQTILLKTFQHLQKSNDTFFEKEFVFALYKQVTRLSDLLSKLDTSLKPETWLKLFKRITETQTVPFKGEPLSGLQVMGILETRAIDFDNLVILNMNEGTFPKDSAPNTFIPFNLRKGFGLPTLEHQDAIFAYYFFRLIHRAKKVKLLFTSGAQGMQSGEMSRFLYQLIYQHPAQPKLFTAVDQVKIHQPPLIHSTKTEAVLIQLQKICSVDKPLSPSALSLYIDCKLRFFYRYLAGIKEPDIITEELDARLFGILFHSALETLYKPFIGKEITPDDLRRLRKDEPKIRETLQLAFKEHFSELSLRDDEINDLQGKNILVYQVLFRYITRFLENEIQASPFHLLGLEEKVKHPFSLKDGKVVYLGGTLDRLDNYQGRYRVIDYKTGSGNNSFAEVAHLFSPEKHKKVKAIFQTLLYSLILKKNYPEYNEIVPSVVWMKSLFTDVSYSLAMGSRNKKTELELSLVKEEYEQQLTELLSELFDPSVPFTATDDKAKCETCPYKVLCSRN